MYSISDAQSNEKAHFRSRYPSDSSPRTMPSPSRLNQTTDTFTIPDQLGSVTNTVTLNPHVPARTA